MSDHRSLAGVRAGYDRWAGFYERDGNPLHAVEEPVVREFAGAVAGREVLDLGCGTGRHAYWLVEGGASVVGVDFSEGMLAAAERRFETDPSVRLVRHDLHEPLPFASSAFDLVVSGLVLEHIADLGTFFAEAARVLRPGGRGVFSTFHPAMFLKGVQARYIDPDSGQRVMVGSLPHQTSDFLNAAIGAGLRIDRVAERFATEDLARRFPRAEKHVGWPLLLAFQTTADRHSSSDGS